jgi:hypothetical protein
MAITKFSLRLLILFILKILFPKILKVNDEEDAWCIQKSYKGKPHGWIQWKNTGVCMDIHCKCGEHSHIDSDFAYSVECPYCGRKYCCNGHIEFIEIKNANPNCLIKGE